MDVKVIKQESTKLTLQIEIDLAEGSMLQSENQIQAALNAAGLEATKVALQQFDTNGSPIDVEGKKLTSKGQVKKNTRPLMGQ